MDLLKWIQTIIERFIKKRLHVCDSCGQPISESESCDICSAERRFVI
jgi:recombinational DNA repair protein RecR